MLGSEGGTKIDIGPAVKKIIIYMGRSDKDVWKVKWEYKKATI